MIKETKLGEVKPKKTVKKKDTVEMIKEKSQIDNIKKINDFMKKNAVWQYVLIGLAVFALSFIFVAQLNTVNRSDETLEGKREAELIDDLTALKREYEELKEENDKNLEIVEEYKTSSSNNSTLINSLTNQLNQIGALSGLKTVKGEGIVVTLDDSDMAITDNISTESMLIHDTDLRAVINELSAAGAEAMSINGQRILANTSIRCVGPVIQVNGVKVAAPFTIKAIGNAKYLESALNIKGGIVDSFEVYGIKANITREKSITISKYDGKLNFSKAVVVEE